MNRRTDGTPSDVAVTLRELGLQSPTGYRVEVNKFFTPLKTSLHVDHKNVIFRICMRMLITASYHQTQR